MSRAAPGTLELRVLGPMELSIQGEPVPLPRSKKCRALLGYLALVRRAHRRDTLSNLLWDVTDDPRGALRWTLSRLRSVLPREMELLSADRDSVRFHAEEIYVDAHELLALRGRALTDLTIEQLESAAALHRGELLEGLELSDYLDFSSWVIGQREELRKLHCELLRALVARLGDRAESALPWARRLAHADAFDTHAHETLLRLLLDTGQLEEAEHRYQHAVRQFHQVGAPQADSLKLAWNALRARATAVRPRVEVPLSSPVVAPSLDSAPLPFVGRKEALEQIRSLLDSVREAASRKAFLITAEPGGGKTRLLERAGVEAESRDYRLLSARAYDVERGRPFGPWIDALGISSDELVEPAQLGGRALLFDRLGSLIQAAAAGKRGLVLALDDVQWLDRDSAEVLEHVLESYAGGPFVALMAARGGELPDNPAMYRLTASLQRAGMLEELELKALSEQEIQALIGKMPEADFERVVRASAGNPLYAIELSRIAHEGQSGAPATLVQLLRERLTRLSSSAYDALRWAAVLGHSFDAARLESLSELSQLELVDALEELERHAFIRIDPARSRERYAFSHDVVREAVYDEISYPRKRLMHRKVALLLQEHGNDPATAYELARHASRAGEHELGVRACIDAGQYSLRTCANADAEALARRGIHHAGDLDEPARVAAMLELLHVLYSARAPQRDEATERVRALAERALDLGLTRAARIGFQMLSYLRWESSSMADAHANILQAERVSRDAEPEERSQALAYAARCLVLLERNLPQAEAFAMEASGLAARGGHSSAAVSFAIAMIAAHRGDVEVAENAFREAQDLARAAGERLAEYNAIEHRLMLALDRDAGEELLPLADELLDLAARVRPGAELAIAGALRALTRLRMELESWDDFVAAVDALRSADAKYELSYVLTRAALHHLEAGRSERAKELATDALEIAEGIGRVSERVIASSILVLIARATDEASGADEYLTRIEELSSADLSSSARKLIDRARRSDN